MTSAAEWPVHQARPCPLFPSPLTIVGGNVVPEWRGPYTAAIATATVRHRQSGSGHPRQWSVAMEVAPSSHYRRPGQSWGKPNSVLFSIAAVADWGERESLELERVLAWIACQPVASLPGWLAKSWSSVKCTEPRPPPPCGRPSCQATEGEGERLKERRKPSKLTGSAPRHGQWKEAEWQSSGPLN